MDGRMAQLLQALDATSADVLLELIAGPARESELIAALSHVDQSTVNRRLHTLREAGLVSQEAGKHRAPGRAWKLAHTAETEQLLDALVSLRGAVAARDQEERADIRTRLRQARARRLGVREVKGSGAE
jgi:DNA-binding HxlR family transcriptional regulator